jgi:hypothetical protein
MTTAIVTFFSGSQGVPSGLFGGLVKCTAESAKEVAVIG